MKRMYKICCCCLLLLVAGWLESNGLKAQGPPVFMDTCLVTNTQRFKGLPIPGEFVPGSYEDLRACPSLGNNVVKINQAKVGKAGNIQMTLRIEGGKLTRTEGVCQGAKNFEKLYQVVVDQAGTPTKMVDQLGVLSYSWEMRFKMKATLELLYDPKSQKALVSVTK